MKSCIISVVLLCFLLAGYAQKSITPIDNEYLLVGTLSDYMGRQKYKKAEKRVDKYYQSEKKLCMSIDSIFKTSYPDLSLSAEKNVISMKYEFQLYSESLVKDIEKFYNYQPSPTKIYSGEADYKTLNLDSLTKTEDFVATYFDTVYTGRLKPGVFKTEHQKLSFITGAYVRFGWYNDSLNYISVPNSVSKVKMLDILLRDVGCSNVKYEIKKGYIPVGHTVYFNPTNKLKSYFEAYKNLR